MTKEAVLYHSAQSDGATVVCDLCRHRCRIADGACGLCRARRNHGGRLVSLVFGRCLYHRPAPIESKPLLHFLPGSKTLSFCTAGCNFKCPFCQNHRDSLCLRDGPGVAPPGEDVQPEHLIEDAVRSGCPSISPTWTEPTVFFEYALAASQLAREKGLAVCFVSNGFMTAEAVALIAPWLDAINVDLKSFSAITYRDVLGGELDGVLDTLKLLHDAGVWVEVSTTFVPGMNDSEDEMRQIADFVADLSPDIPWIPNCFHPAYRMMDTPRTPVSKVERAVEIARDAGLRYVYHFDGEGRRDTLCAACGKLLIERERRSMTANHLAANASCPACGVHCPGVWQRPGTKEMATHPRWCRRPESRNDA